VKNPFDFSERQRYNLFEKITLIRHSVQNLI